MKLKIGLIGAIHPNMPGDDTGIYLQIIRDLQAMQEQYGYELAFVPEPMRSEEDARRAVATMNEEAVDFTMLITPSLGYGRVMIPMVKLQSRLGLWSLPEPTQSGVLQLNSFCGLNMFSAIIDKYWKHEDIPLKWFYGYPQSKMFQERFAITLKALAGIKAIETARIGVVGDVADGFENFIFDERKLMSKFGSYVYTRHSVPDIVKMAKSLSDQDVYEYMNELLEEGQPSARMESEHMQRFCRVTLALERFAQEHGYNALAVNCWPTFQEYYDISVCGAMSHLNEKGIVTTCEADVHAALDMLMLNAISGGKAALMDLVSIDDTDHSVNLWHCGPAPKCFAGEKGLTWDNHFNIGCYCEEKWVGKGVVADLAFKPGKLTIARTSTSFDDMFVMTGEVLNKAGYEGSSGWMGKLSIGGESIDAPTFIETLIDNRIDHHFPVVYGDYTNELNEVAAWLKLGMAKPIPYVPYMRNKPQKPLV